MTERPISYSPAMVRARRAGLKTQTRRVMRLQPPDWAPHKLVVGREHYFYEGTNTTPARCWPDFAKAVLCPFGAIGDRLWVREAWRTLADFDNYPPRELVHTCPLRYEADGACSAPGFIEGFGRYRPPMFMPRWASRGLDEIVNIRVERLQDISEADAIAEGVMPKPDGKGYFDIAIDPNWQVKHGVHWATAAEAYHALWNDINGPNNWALNLWVWRVEFKVITP